MPQVEDFSSSTDHDFSRLLRLTLMWHSKFRIDGIYKVQSSDVPRFVGPFNPAATPFSITLWGFCQMSEQYKPVYGVLLTASVQCIPAQWPPSGQHSDQCQRDVILFVMRPAIMCSRNVKTTTPLLSSVQIINADMGIINNGSHVESWLPSISIFFG